MPWVCAHRASVIYRKTGSPVDPVFPIRDIRAITRFSTFYSLPPSRILRPHLRPSVASRSVLRTSITCPGVGIKSNKNAITATCVERLLRAALKRTANGTEEEQVAAVGALERTARTREREKKEQNALGRFSLFDNSREMRAEDQRNLVKS